MKETDDILPDPPSIRHIRIDPDVDHRDQPTKRPQPFGREATTPLTPQPRKSKPAPPKPQRLPTSVAHANPNQESISKTVPEHRRGTGSGMTSAPPRIAPAIPDTEDW